METPSSDMEIQLNLLTASLHRAFTVTANLDEIADLVVRGLLPDTAAYADDVTLLLVSFPAAPWATSHGNWLASASRLPPHETRETDVDRITEPPTTGAQKAGVPVSPSSAAA
ncbi:hypothetical protein G3I60_04115 [Streptomyces sp. SID13666]|uniref:hypothetical protein n=1 Tax=unclassified Streptomyces TaxID=2593676 RepID=UPI0013C1F35A|nr:hypothetical protein [Streptomyces sp. SID13666]NEA69306.1 hypothetical protein [Streptomyces sp. SID13588]